MQRSQRTDDSLRLRQQYLNFNFIKDTIRLHLF